jgi:uncharacterized OB-fold protein
MLPWPAKLTTRQILRRSGSVGRVLGRSDPSAPTLAPTIGHIQGAPVTKTTEPAIEGWFTLDPDAPALLGTRCVSCGSYFFPRETEFCRNPACTSRDFDQVELSRRGTVWSFTDNRYQPPPPYVSADPFEPYTIAAVELEAEKLVVLGQMVPGVAPESMRAGMQVELTLGPLYETDERTVLMWKWRPVDIDGGAA